MDRNCNPFAILNKQAHIISGNLPELRYAVSYVFPLHKWAPNPYFSSALTQKSF